MASLPPSLRSTLEYFAKYNYPLTADELYFWQHGTRLPKSKVKRFAKASLSPIRKQRFKYSLKKWIIAQKIGESLKKFPTISAIFVTGALAMNNCPADDDIDLMIITSPNTLWITRFFVNIFLHSLRRHPGDKKAPNKICPNLWMDTNHLVMHTHSIYIAHEILQAKILWDRAGIHGRFLRSNSWIKKYLPVAHKYLTLSPSPKFRRGKPQQGEVFLKLLNLLFFVTQYLYMKPKMTSEKVGLGFAFFHPSRDVIHASTKSR